MKELILLIQFFTRIPIKSKIDYNEGKYGKSTYLLPLIGLLIGGIIFFVYKGSLYVSALNGGGGISVISPLASFMSCKLYIVSDCTMVYPSIGCISKSPQAAHKLVSFENM